MKTFLHVGCGTAIKHPFKDWKELRLDIDPKVNPDIVGNMTNIPLPNESVDAIYSSHNLEHLYAHEIPLALAEFRRVLNKNGFAIILCPDLQYISSIIAEDKLLDTLYTAEIGNISPLDIVYGHRGAIAAGNIFMSHKCGFTRSVLVNLLKEADFTTVASIARNNLFDIFAIATVSHMDEADLRNLASIYGNS